jgi:hypothetical protein
VLRWELGSRGEYSGITHTRTRVLLPFSPQSLVRQYPPALVTLAQLTTDKIIVAHISLTARVVFLIAHRVVVVVALVVIIALVIVAACIGVVAHIGVAAAHILFPAALVVVVALVLFGQVKSDNVAHFFHNKDHNRNT